MPCAYRVPPRWDHFKHSYDDLWLLFWVEVRSQTQVNPSTYPVIAFISTILVSGAFQLLIAMIYYWWKKRQEEPDEFMKEMRRDLNATMAAFTAHTGITINGKSYRTGE
jgi:hypothetical protein